MKRILLISVSLMILFSSFYGCKKKDEEIIYAEIIVSPAEVHLNNIDTAIFYISTYPEKEVVWNAAFSESWLEIIPSSGTLNGQIMEIMAVSRIEGLDEDYYSSKLEIISNGAGKGTAFVRLNVGAYPVMEVIPVSINIPENEAGSKFSIKNAGNGFLRWELNPNDSWLQLMPDSGVLNTGESIEVAVVADRAGMPVGDYSTTIAVQTNAENQVDDITVGLQVGEYAFMTFNTDTLNFGYFENEKDLYISNTGNIDLNWSLSLDETYISADKLSGSLAMGDTEGITVNLLRDGLQVGNYSAIMHFEDDNGEIVDLPLVFVVYEEEKWLLDHKIIDAEYDRVNDVIIAVTEAPYKLLKLDPTTETIESIDLNLQPKCVSVLPDGTRAAVGHDGKVTYADLQSMTSIGIYSVPDIANDIVIAPNLYAYVFPETGQWTSIQCVNLETGDLSSSGGYSIRDRTKAKLHPFGDYIYGADNGLSPSDFEKYDIRPGTAAYMYDSPYHGDYSFGGDIWISDDGLRLFARTRNVFNSSENEATDMTYNGQLQGESYIVTLDHSSAANRIFTIESAEDNYWNYYPSNEVRMYEATYLNYLDSQYLPDFIVPQSGGTTANIESEGHFGFFNNAGTKYYVLVRACEGSGLIYDWAVATLDVQ